MTTSKKILAALFSLPKIIILLLLAAAAVYFARGVYRGGTAVKEILWENVKLKQAITNLTDAGKIGYAKVLSQTKDQQGRILLTTLKFVETARDNELQIILEKEFAIPGDIVHFDALVVKFGDKMVMDGRKKSLYLWRRIYGEQTPPDQAFPVEQPGLAPRRYENLLAELPAEQSSTFWQAIWDLANDPAKLQQYDIEAIYGNVTYTKLQPGLVYIFRITAAGQIYPEVMLDI